MKFNRLTIFVFSLISISFLLLSPIFPPFSNLLLSPLSLFKSPYLQLQAGSKKREASFKKKAMAKLGFHVILCFIFIVNCLLVLQCIARKYPHWSLFMAFSFALPLPPFRLISFTVFAGGCLLQRAAKLDMVLAWSGEVAGHQHIHGLSPVKLQLQLRFRGRLHQGSNLDHTHSQKCMSLMDPNRSRQSLHCSSVVLSCPLYIHIHTHTHEIICVCIRHIYCLFISVPKSFPGLLLGGGHPCIRSQFVGIRLVYQDVGIWSMSIAERFKT